jgi:hypothetical protein
VPDCTEGYKVSQRKRKRVEEIFDGLKMVGGMRKLRFIGEARTQIAACRSVAAYNLLRIANCELRIANCELRIANCELRIAERGGGFFLEMPRHDESSHQVFLVFLGPYVKPMLLFSVLSVPLLGLLFKVFRRRPCAENDAQPYTPPDPGERPCAGDFRQ